MSAAATGGLALAEQQLLAERDPGPEPGQAGRGHDGRAPGGQEPFVVLRVAEVDGLADRQVHDGVAEELEALVVGRRRVRMLVQVAAVDERLMEEARILEVEAEAARE